jgi:hypothetical protein
MAQLDKVSGHRDPGRAGADDGNLLSVDGAICGSGNSCSNRAKSLANRSSRPMATALVLFP